MAEQKIQFTIGSIFKGEGFNKAKNSVDNLNKKVKQSIGVSNQLAGAFGGMNNSAGKAANAMSGLISAFLQGGVAMAGVQAVMLGINALMDIYQKKQEEVKKATDDYNAACKKLKETQDRIWNEDLNNRINSTIEKIKTIAQEFETVTKNANDFKGVIDKMRSANGKGIILKMEGDKLADMSSSGADNKESVEAWHNYQMQLKKNEIALKEAEEAITKAKDAEQENTERMRSIRERNAEVMGKLRDLRFELSKVEGNDLQKRKKISDKIDALEKERVKLIDEFKKAQTQQNILKQNTVLKEQERDNQIQENHNLEVAAKQKVTEANEKQAESIKKRTEEREKTEQELNATLRKIAEDELKAQMTQAKSDYDSAKKEGDALRTKQKEIKAKFMNGSALNGLTGNNGQALGGTVGGYGNSGGKNGMGYSGVGNSVGPSYGLWQSYGQFIAGNPSGKNYNGYASDWIKNQIASMKENGQIRNSDDARKMQKALERQARDYANSKEARKIRADEKRLNDLETKREKGYKLSKDEKAKLQSLREDQKKRNEAAGAGEQDYGDGSTKAEIDAANRLQEIKDMLDEKLGVK